MIIPRRRWVLLGLAAVLLAAAAFALRPGAEDHGAWMTASVERGPIRTSVSASGTLQAVLTVQVGSQVTGRIQSLHADFNSLVRSGQIIARIDPATFEAALVRARADLEDARAGVATARSALMNQNANREAVRVARQDAERVHRRSLELSRSGVVSERDLEASEAAMRETEARLNQAEAQVGAAEAAIEQALARVKQAEAQVKLAEVNLDYTVITSPVDGVVVSRSVDVGQTVSASLQAPTLFVIANDLTRMQVVANVDEADIGQIGPQAEVSFTVDSFPGESFSGRIDQIRLNPIVTQNVVTYSVIVNVSNPQLKLRPGMTANTTFTIAQSEDALRLPNAALRFWPPTEPRERERELLSAFAPVREEGTLLPPQAEARAVESAPRAAVQDGVLRFPQFEKARFRPRVIWVKGKAGVPEARVVRVGITDGSASEVMEGDLPEGAEVITGSEQAVAARPAASPFGSPLGGRPSMKGGGGRRP